MATERVGVADDWSRVVGRRRPEAWLAAAGFGGITITSLCYALAPPAAVLPTHPFDAAAAFAGAVAGRPMMQLAGSIGVVSDIVALMGALVLVVRLAGRGRNLAAAAWGGVLSSILVFTVVDTMVGFVLPRLAQMGAREAFIGAKMLFDALFLSGTLAFGIGAVALGISAWRANDLACGRSAAVAVLVVGCAAWASSIGCAAGASVELAVGGSIGAGGLVFTWIAAMWAYFPDRAN